jgi:transmembrane sensor
MSNCNEFNGRELPTPREQAAEWFVRQDSGRLSEDDRRKFEQWLDSDPQNRAEYQAVQEVWRELDGLKDTFLPSNVRLRNSWCGKKVWNHLVVAASLAFFVFAGYLALFYTPGSYETARGEMRTEHLADGSVIRLNSDTSLKVDFTEIQRTVSLIRGEAYFEVAQESDRPFVVESAGGSTRAVGTQFSVYRDSADVRVMVVEGNVEVATVDGDARMLEADEMVAYRSDGRSLSMVEPLQSNDLDWLDGRLSFEAMPLVDVVIQLNRYLKTPLYVVDHGLNNLKLSGTFHIANLEEIPELLPRLLPVTLRRSGDRVLILSSN